MNELADEYRAWLEERAMPLACANELLMSDSIFPCLTSTERYWLTDFSERWDRQQAIVDRIKHIASCFGTTLA